EPESFKVAQRIASSGKRKDGKSIHQRQPKDLPKEKEILNGTGTVKVGVAPNNLVIEALNNCDAQTLQDAVNHVQRMKAMNCYNCSENGHRSWTCPKPCRSCPAADHAARDCPRKAL